MSLRPSLAVVFFICMASTIIHDELMRQQLNKSNILGKLEVHRAALKDAKGETVAILNSKIKSAERSVELIDACLGALNGSLTAVKADEARVGAQPGVPRHVDPALHEVVNPFLTVPAYPHGATVGEHAEWRLFYPVSNKFTAVPSKIRPDVSFPSYKRGADVRVFLRAWKHVCCTHMLHGYLPDTTHLFFSLSNAIIALDWGESYIPKCHEQVPCLISRLLVSFGGNNQSLEAYQRLQALAPNAPVTSVLSAFEEHAPKVLEKEASKASLASLFISKIEEAIGLHLCTREFEDFQAASEEALKIHNSRVRSRALGVPCTVSSGVPSTNSATAAKPDPSSMDWTAAVGELQASVNALSSRVASAKGGQGRQGMAGARQGKGPGRGKVQCYNCSGFGHFADQCPSDRKPPPAASPSSSSSSSN